MNNLKIKIVMQERHIRLRELIEMHIVSETPILILCPIATGLQRVKFSNIYIAPDSETINYVKLVEALLNKQNQIYYPIYIKLMRIFKRLNFLKNEQFNIEYLRG